VKWTAMRVTKADGAPLHGVGVLPTERVEPTLPAVLQGRDEVLERALKLLGSGQR
jgi:C-terminal processing protease CtpA/Prc